MLLSGSSRTLARESASSMADSSTSSRWAAIATICLRSMVPASLTAPAVIGPLRLPWVPAP